MMIKALVCMVIVLGTLGARAEDTATTQDADRALAYERARDDLIRQDPAEAAKVETLGVFFAQMVLAKLGYESGSFDGVLDDRTRETVREYQRARRIPVTGDPLSFDTWQKLAADNEVLDYQPVYAPSREFSAWFWNSGSFGASGTWVIVGERQAVPEQTSKIDCDRERGTCIEATAMIERADPRTGLPTSAASNDTHLSVDMDTYQIERWDENEIVTKPRHFQCVQYVLRFNRLEKSATAIRSRTSTGGECEGIGGEKHLKLTSGFRVYWNLRRHADKIRRRLVRMAPAVRTLVESRACGLSTQGLLALPGPFVVPWTCPPAR